MVHLGVITLELSEPRRPPLGDEALYQTAAIELLQTGSTDLNPLWPPLYLFFLAALRWLGRDSWWLVPWVQGGLLVLAAWLLRSLGRRLLGNVPEMDLAAILMLLYPPLVAFTHYFWPEVLHLVLMLAVAEILLAARRDSTWMLGLGLLLGLAIACKALLTPWVPILLWWAGRRPAEERRRFWTVAWGPVAWASLGLSLVTLPLMAWNSHRVGVFTLSDSVAFNLWVGLEETSRKSFVGEVAGVEYRTFLDSGTSFAERQAVLWSKIRRRVQERKVLDLVKAQLGRQYFRVFDKDSFFTDQLPGGVVANQKKGWGYRSASPLLVTLLRNTSYFLYTGILLLACLGMAVCVPTRRPWLWAVAGFLAYNLLLFLALHVKSRYRIQLLPWLFLYATCGISWLRQRLGGGELPLVLQPVTDRSRPVSWRWGLCAASMTTCLYLAFWQ